MESSAIIELIKKKAFNGFTSLLRSLRLSIKAVVFDYGQVISFPQDPAVLDRLAERAGVSREKFESVIWVLRAEFDRGTITAKEYYHNILSALDVNLDEKTMDKMIEMDFESWRNINPATEALMEDVKKAGYILGILSNMPHEFLGWARKNVPAFQLPHISVFSCEANSIKPEEAIYHKLISLAGVKPEEIVFFDDNSENVKCACALGMVAFIWTNPEDAKKELLALGVKL